MLPLCLCVNAAALVVSSPFAPPLDKGLTFRVYQVVAAPQSMPTVAPNQTPNADVLLSAIDLRDAKAFPAVDAPLVATGLGWIEIDRATTATFRLTSDDGARLTVDGAVVVNHDGRHGATPKLSEPIALAAGLHPLRLDYFDAGGKRALVLEWKREGSERFEVLDATVLRADPDLARVSGPGIKRVVDTRRPGDGIPVAGLHPSFVRRPARPSDYHPKIGSLCILPDGRVVLGTFDPLQRDEEKLPDITAKRPDGLVAIGGLASDDPARFTLTPIAEGLFEPCGLCAVGSDLYVSHRLAITRFRDLDGDGSYEDRTDVASGWEGWNYHQFTFGLVHVPAPKELGGRGHLYASLSTAMAPPAWEGMGTNAAPNGVGRGSIIEVDLDSEDWRVIAGGVRTPNGLGRGPEGILVYCDNQGTWFPASTLSVVEPGRFFGHFNNTNVVPKLLERFPSGGRASVFCDRQRAEAAVYFPHNECGNSPTQPLLVERGPWAGQMLVGDITQGGLHRVALEKVAGQWQGVVFRCTQGLECGINRIAWEPTGGSYGTLVLGGIGAGGNWNWNGTQFGLERLAMTDAVAFEMQSVTAEPSGFAIRFTKPIDRAWLADPSHFKLAAWRYQPTAAYGGPKIGEHAIRVTKAEPGADGSSVRLTCEGLEAGTCVHLRVDPVSTGGEPIWSTDAWYTLNRLAVAGSTVLEDGFTGLGAIAPSLAMPIIGRSSDVALVTRKDAKVSRSDQRSQADLMKLSGVLVLDTTGGDRITKVVHRSMRLHAEWRSADGKATISFGDAMPFTVEAAPNVWHAFDGWFDAGAGTSPASLHARIDGAAPQTTTFAAPIPIGPLAFVARSVNTEFRNAWIAPLHEVSHWNSDGSATGPWTSLVGGALDAPDSPWAIRGGTANYRLDGETIVGSSVPKSANSFLTTKRRYRDFELLVDVRQHSELNSGIQIRSEVDGGFASRDGELTGYQVELDPSDRAYSAGIYDEARRGWIAPLTDAPYARDAYRRGEWNRIRVLAEGPVIRTWINGIPAATVFDEMNREGHIALQVHGVGDRVEPLTVEWRNLRIREIAQTVDESRE
jgi:hypothetical protein